MANVNELSSKQSNGHNLESNRHLKNGDFFKHNEIKDKIKREKRETFELKVLLNQKSKNKLSDNISDDKSSDNCEIESLGHTKANIANKKQIFGHRVSFGDQSSVSFEGKGVTNFEGDVTTYDSQMITIEKEENKNIIEVLRQVVRTCTQPDASKRPSANDINQLLNSYL
ncbi:uncharacterized protein LOC128963783 [Oppia nitens]|uniref:uncharacterized protein LOC128963783 n=1 Tax=Oppia nitens TaxID=1686743 RepID=UPI0023DC48C1|nr:uncharacterized protein LOC128963783 [Oppia nitens]